MSIQQTIPVPVGKLSRPMCAVLRIVTAEQLLSDAVFPFLNIQDDTVDWEAIFKLDLDSGSRAAMEFAYTVWTNQPRVDGDLFRDALSMNPVLKRACLKALGIRWGL